MERISIRPLRLRPTAAVLLLSLCAPGLGQSWNQTARTPGHGGGFGESVGLFGSTAVMGAEGANAAYVLERNAGGLDAWGEELELFAAENQPFDRFGSAVAIDGDTIAVGARLADSGSGGPTGAAYVFERDLGGAGSWGERRRIDRPDGTQEFGDSLALGGDTLAVAATKDGLSGVGTFSGAVYLFERDLGGPDNWGFVARLQPADLAAFDRFGRSIAVQGDTLLVASASPSTLGAGAVYVFERDAGGPGAWGEIAKLTAPIPGSYGESLDLDGEILVVGAASHTLFGFSAGLAFVHGRNQSGPGQWGLVTQLAGSNLDAGDAFGNGVAVHGDTIAVGSYGDEPAGNQSGSVYLFERDLGGPEAWGERTRLVAGDGDHWDRLGFDVDLHGDGVLAGAPGDEPVFLGAGSLYAFHRDQAVAYCAPGASASYCMASLFSTGLPSATASSGFAVHAIAVEGAKDGLFFFGTQGRQANPWGNGTSYQCVVPPVVRGGLLTGVGSIDNCDGAFAQDLNQLWAASPPKNPGAGALVQLQLWYRDPQSTSNQTTSLSDAIEFTVGN